MEKHDKKPLPFECKRCNICCTGEGGIMYDPEEVPAAAEYLGISTEEFISLYCEEKNGRYGIKTGDDKVCLMMGENGCKIHPVKPRICRHWPFLETILQRPHALEDAKLGCPGIDPDVSHEEFVRFARATDKPEPILP